MSLARLPGVIARINPHTHAVMMVSAVCDTLFFARVDVKYAQGSVQWIFLPDDELMMRHLRAIPRRVCFLNT